MRRFYEQNPHKVFSHLNIGPTINKLPGEKRSIAIFQLFISDKLLEIIARWTNEWFQVKKATGPNKHKAPFKPIPDSAELNAYIGVLLAVNQNIDLLQYEHYFHHDKSKRLLLTPGFHKAFSEKRFSQLNRYIFCDLNSANQGNECSREKLAKVKPFLEHLQAACKAY